MNRIQKCFERTRAAGRPAFIAYLTMGYPTLAASEEAADTLLANGADIIELGVPFSDPIADGAVIRTAAYAALAQGVTLADILALAGRLRAKHPDAPLVVISYYNVIYSYGLEKFAADAEAAGVDAVLSVVVAEHHERGVGVLRAEASGEREDVRERHALRERGVGGRADHGAVGDGIRERHSELDYVGAVREKRVCGLFAHGEAWIAHSQVGDECRTARRPRLCKTFLYTVHFNSPLDFLPQRTQRNTEILNSNHLRLII